MLYNGISKQKGKLQRMQIGEKLGRYEIREKIGEGGMGEVYRAYDEQLDRDVVIKNLLEKYVENTELVKRFKLEAKAVSALNHPNIITIYEVVESEGTLSIIYEYISGKTLRDKIVRNQLTLPDSIKIAEQIARGLEAAHNAGIIHRDIKPENIMIRDDDYVKILDFGLAKKRFLDIESGGDEADLVKTRKGMIMGSIQYMSPEQAAGKKVDGQTDIFSLGTVLYEMLSGKLPFDGETLSEILASIQKSEAVPIQNVREYLPDEIIRIVNKTLEKDTEKRYQNAKQLKDDLRQFLNKKSFEEELERTSQPNSSPDADTEIISISTVATEILQVDTAENQKTVTTERVRNISLFRKVSAGFILLGILVFGFWFYSMSNQNDPINSLAVLPFSSENGNTDTDYLSDGLTESIIYNLSKLPSLKVLPTGAVFRYKGKDVDANTVAGELGVRAVLISRIKKRDDNLEISTELIDTQENKILWGEHYTRKVADALEIQKDISREISERLGLQLTSGEEKKVTRDYTQNKEAFQAYLHGRFLWNRRNEKNIRRGIEYFERAIELDPNYALAWSGLADSYNVSSDYMDITRKEAANKAKSAANRALEIDPNLAEAHTSLAAVKHFHEWDFKGAVKEFKIATELNPTYALARNWYAHILGKTGNHEEAIKQARKAVEIEPFYVSANYRLGQQLYLAKRYEDAIKQHEKTIEIDAKYLYSQLDTINSLTKLGRAEEAIEKTNENLADSDRNQFYLVALSLAHIAAGNKQPARNILKELNDRKKTEKIKYLNIATIYANLGEKDLAFEMLEKSLKDREDDITFLKVNPMFEDLHSDPRFPDLLKRIGLS